MSEISLQNISNLFHHYEFEKCCKRDLKQENKDLSNLKSMLETATGCSISQELNAIIFSGYDDNLIVSRIFLES